MAHDQSSQTTLAAEEGLGSVTLCGCDVVSLHLGAFTLRMERKAFGHLEQLIAEAARELAARAVLPAEAAQAVGPLIH